MGDWSPETIITFFQNSIYHTTSIESFRGAYNYLQTLSYAHITDNLRIAISKSYRDFVSILRNPSIVEADLIFLKHFFRDLFCTESSYVPTHIGRISYVNAECDALEQQQIITLAEKESIQALILEQYRRRFVAHVFSLTGKSIISRGTHSYTFDLDGSHPGCTRYFIKKYLRAVIDNLKLAQKPPVSKGLAALKFSKNSTDTLQKRAKRTYDFGFVLEGRCLPDSKHAISIYIAQKESDVWICIGNRGARNPVLVPGICMYRIRSSSREYVISTLKLSQEEFTKYDVLYTDCVSKHMQILTTLCTVSGAELIGCFLLSEQMSGNCVYYAHLMIIFSHIACYHAHNILQSDMGAFLASTAYSRLCGLVKKDYNWVVHELQIHSIREYLAQQAQHMQNGNIDFIDKRFLTSLVIRAGGLYGNAIISSNSIKNICLLLLTTSLARYPQYNLSLSELLLGGQLRRAATHSPWRIFTFGMSTIMLMALARLCKARAPITMGLGGLAISAAMLWQHQSLRASVKSQYKISVIPEPATQNMITAAASRLTLARIN